MPNGDSAMSFSSPVSTRRYIRAQELATRLAVHRSTLWRWVHDGHLPRPVRLGPNTVAWDCTQIDAWLAERAGGADGGGARAAVWSWALGGARCTLGARVDREEGRRTVEGGLS